MVVLTTIQPLFYVCKETQKHSSRYQKRASIDILYQGIHVDVQRQGLTFERIDS